MIKEQLQRARQLDQTHFTDTNAAAVYSPSKGVKGEITSIFVANNSGSAITYNIFHDDDGTTYSNLTSLFFGVELAANSTDLITLEEAGVIVDGDTDGTVGAQCNTANVMTITLYGWEITN